jgi:murein DD-endopeptidase MepM/ murein hydrolase activator NlpD
VDSGDGQPLSIDPSRFEQIRNTDYVVQPGDTISEIAERFGLYPGTILSMNSVVSDVRRLPVGLTLSIPDRDGIIYSVQPGDSISSIATEYEISQAALLDANDIRSPVLQVNDTLFLPGVLMAQDQYLMAIGELFTWPLRAGSYRFTSGYGMRIHPIDGTWHMHTGIDLAAVVGTPVLASRAGRVVYIERNSAQYGNFVIIDHGDGFRSLYAHLNSISVSVGVRVGTLQQLGTVGNTGRSTGPHLHFAIMRGGSGATINPLSQLPR